MEVLACAGVAGVVLACAGVLACDGVVVESVGGLAAHAVTQSEAVAAANKCLFKCFIMNFLLN